MLTGIGEDSARWSITLETETMAENHRFNPIEQVRASLRRWADQEGFDLQTLVDWLQGTGLPAVGHDEEPFVWLLRGLPTGANRHAVSEKLAEGIARLLGQRPDVERIGDRPEQLLYNLLEVATHLNYPDQLASPLHELFRRKRLNGSWAGVDLRHVLRSALISNQRDNRLYAEWKSLLETREHGFLGGNETDGLDAVRLMPASEDERGEPTMDAIGHALLWMARHLANQDDFRFQFRQQLRIVSETYPEYPEWDYLLLRQAHEHRWPKRAIECLDVLAFLPNSPFRASHFLWDYYLPFLPATSIRQRGALCDGIVAEVEVDSDAQPVLNALIPPVERARAINPFPGGLDGVVGQEMQVGEAKARLNNDENAALALVAARQRLLDRTLNRPA